MFDANARHLPDGELFFVECHSINPDNILMGKSLEQGKNYLCKKVGDNPDKCEFHIYIDNTVEDYYRFVMDFDTDDFDFYSLFVYSGCPNGTDFISEEWKQKALDFLEGEWYA